MRLRKRTMQKVASATVMLSCAVGASARENKAGTENSAQPKIKAESLSKRYKRLACAVVHISNQAESGTGFFIDRDGTIATATHVLYQTVYGGTQAAPTITLNHPNGNVQITTYSRETFEYAYPTELSYADYTRATADLTLINTHHKTECFLPLSKRNEGEVGEHVIAVGWPGLADNQVLYEGFLSSTGKALPFPVGQIGGNPVYPSYRLLRIQMPITPGASGGPLVDDRDEVIGVISQVPVIWSQDLQQIINVYATTGRSSGVLISGFDVNKLVAQLAFIVHEFETSGSGLAIPVSYFEPPAASSAAGK